MEHLDLTRFQPSDKDEWLELAQQQLKGADPMEQLSWSPLPEIFSMPYYDAEDTKDLEYLSNFFSESPSLNWRLYEKVSADNAEDANSEALNALAGGCDGIVFEVPDSIDGERLLQDIDTSICDISFITGPLSASASGIGFDARESSSSFVSLDNQQSVLDQIVTLLYEYKGGNQVVRNSSPDFFLEIASLRATRYLLKKVHNTDPWKITIHSFIPVHETPDQQWFLNTTAGLAAVIGSSNSVCFYTADAKNRISRNVGNLIREESGITAYEDQCGGSYYIESLTHQLIKVVLNKLDQK